MLSPLYSHLLIPFLIAIFLGINMGGSGTAPSFSAAYGANIIRKSFIPGLFGVMVFLGAMLAGKKTATTVGSELMDPQFLTFTTTSIVLFSVSIALLISNLLGVPQSTSQTTVFAIAAPAIYFSKLNSHKLFFQVLPTWFVMPLAAFILCFIIGKYIYKPLRRRGYTISKAFLENPVVDVLIIIMSCYVAFSLGSNNVANAVGPITMMTVNELDIVPSAVNFKLLVIMGTLIVAPSFGIGSSILGHKVLKKTGKEIVLFGKLEAIIIAFVSASLLLAASVSKGIPTSLVQINVGAILGIGVAKLGFGNIFKRTQINQFFLLWIVSPLIAFSLTFGLIYLTDVFQITF